jgi:hypothetical protein
MTFKEAFFDSLFDPTLKILIGAAVASLLFGLFSDN